MFGYVWLVSKLASCCVDYDFQWFGHHNHQTSAITKPWAAHGLQDCRTKGEEEDLFDTTPVVKPSNPSQTVLRLCLSTATQTSVPTHHVWNEFPPTEPRNESPKRPRGRLSLMWLDLWRERRSLGWPKMAPSPESPGILDGYIHIYIYTYIQVQRVYSLWNDTRMKHKFCQVFHLYGSIVMSCHV